MRQEGLFTEVRLQPDRDRFFKQLLKENAPLECKGLVSGTLICRPLGREGNHLKVLAVSLVDADAVIPSQSVVASFVVKDEMLFFESQLNGTPEGYSLSLEGPLFRLMRRDAYRVKFPERFPARLILRMVDRDVLEVEYDLLNLNSGGFAFLIRGLASDKFKPATEVEGRVELGDLLDFSFKGRIRHQTPMEMEPGHAAVGVQFLDLSTRDRQKLISAVMRVHREIFT